MNTADEFKKIFNDKLISSGDMDKAFNKAIWIAYNEGLLEGLSDTRENKERVIDEVLKVLKRPKQSNGMSLSLGL